MRSRPGEVHRDDALERELPGLGMPQGAAQGGLPIGIARVEMEIPVVDLVDTKVLGAEARLQGGMLRRPRERGVGRQLSAAAWAFLEGAERPEGEPRHGHGRVARTAESDATGDRDALRTRDEGHA